MSYTKLWKVSQDYGLGVLSTLLADQNMQEQQAGWLVEHGSDVAASVAGGPLLFGNPYTSFGTHTTPAVPRASVRVQPTSGQGVAVTANFNSLNGVVRGVSHISTGVWQINLDDRLTLFFADPRPVQSNSTVTRFCQPYGSLIGTNQSGIVVNTYELNAGDFVLTDYEFSCEIYSYV